MPKKIKTRQSVAKRVTIKKKKILMKKGGQGHFNARESGKITRLKRRVQTLKKTNRDKTIRAAVPYAK